MKVDLAEEGRDGSVWLCSHCDDIHMRWENWTVTLTRPQFEKLSLMAEAAGRKLRQMKSPAPSMGTGSVNETAVLH